MQLAINTPEPWFFGTSWRDFSALEKIALTLVISTPFFFLSIPHWITNTSMLACVFAIAALIKNRAQYDFKNIPHRTLICLIFSIYTIAIIVSQIGRQHFVIKEYLDQTRWLVGLPFFFFIYATRLNYVKVLDWAIPVGIFAAWISSTYIIPSDAWGDRATISFMDPLAFGFLNLSLALICFSSAVYDVQRKQTSWNTLLKAAAFLMGAYLSIRSGSRSGWAAFPVVTLGVLYFLYKPNIKNTFLLILSMALALTALYHFNATVQIRVSTLIQELVQYPWSGGMAPDNSVGMRITFYRLGSYYFSQSPWFGWGERGYADIKDALPLLSYSSQFTRDFAYVSLFHSEWTTQAVRLGMLGLIGVFIVFFAPIKLLFNAIKSSDLYLKNAYIGLSHMTCLLVASIGDEVFNSKSMITFTAVIISGLLANRHAHHLRIKTKL